MSAIVTCTCGSRLRLPEQASGKVFHCPKCQAEIVPPVEAKVVSSFRERAGTKEALCPICQSAIGGTEPVLTCPSCEQIHHQECWQEVGGCSTYGCEQAPAPTKEAPPAARPLTAWGDTKRCPACGETIKSIALRCRYCKTDFDTVDPLTVKDLRRGAKKAKNVRQMQTNVIVLFILSLIGCLAPVALIAGLIVLLPKRQLLAKAGPFYMVLGYAALVLSALYCLLMIGFLIQ
jgi:hypothetical protein